MARNDFEKAFYKLLNNSFSGKTMINIRNRLRLEFIRKGDTEKIIQQQSKITFNGFRKSYENCDSYTFDQNEVLMDKLIYQGFAILKLRKFLIYETYYDKLQSYFGEKTLHLQYMITDSFVSSVNTHIIIRDLKKNLENSFDFSN